MIETFHASAPYLDLAIFVPTRFILHLSFIGVTGDGEGGLHVQDPGGEQPKGSEGSHPGRCFYSLDYADFPLLFAFFFQCCGLWIRIGVSADPRILFFSLSPDLSQILKSQKV
jgi:hypothetical protein